MGRARLAAYHGEVAGVLADMTFRPTAVHLCGEAAAVSWRARLRAPSGLSVECEGIDVFQFASDGRIFKLTGFWNPEAAFTALGLAG